MPYLPRTSDAERKRIAVVNRAPEETTFENLRGICMGVSTYRFPMHTEGLKYNEIVPGLFLGEGPLNVPKMKKLGITRVLELGAVKNILVTDNCHNPYKDDDLRYMSLKFADIETSSIDSHFEDCAKFIERGLNQGGVYIFSPNGTSRSATIVAAFLMLRRGLTGVEALRSIHIRKPVRPNDGFLNQLVKLDREIRNRRSKFASHLEVSMECPCVKTKPLHAPFVYFRDPKTYSLSMLGRNRQKIAQKMYFHSEDATKNPITHTERGTVKQIIFKAI